MLRRFVTWSVALMLILSAVLLSSCDKGEEQGEMDTGSESTQPVIPLISQDASDDQIRAHLKMRGVKFYSVHKGQLYLQHTDTPDLSALKGLPLRRLSFYKTETSDLSPLKGMPLESLEIGLTKVTDLSPLRGMPLRSLYMHWTKVGDLGPLKGMPLTNLLMSHTAVEDLSPLRGMPLVELAMVEAKVTDLSPLEGMPLVVLRFTPHAITSGMEVVRRIATLKKICGTPAEAFWKLYDGGYIPRRPKTVSPIAIRKEGRRWEGPFPERIGGASLSCEATIIYKDGKPWSGCITRGGGSMDDWHLDGYVDGKLVSSMTLRKYYEMINRKVEPTTQPRRPRQRLE